MTMSLKTKLTMAIALVAVLTVALISFAANLMIGQQFKSYIIKQQTKQIGDIVLRLSRQFDPAQSRWNIDFLHAIGMSALYEGYIVKVYDASGVPLWDAESCDMASCRQVMDDIIQRMRAAYPKESGQFTLKRYPLAQEGQTIGEAVVTSYGPYFLSENDMLFIGTLNKVLPAIGAVALLLSFAVGVFMSRRISRPILQVARVVEQIAGGQRGARLAGQSGTKELDKLTGSVNELAQSIQTQEELRKQLTADVAHELRTPLTTMQTHLEAMVMGVWQPTPQRLQSNLDEVVRIGKIVADLENLARAESGAQALSKSPVDVLELARSVVSGFEGEMKKSRLTATVEGDCGTVPADRDRLAQVLSNLLSNAVKFTPEEGSVSVLLSSDGDFAMIRVRDTGNGIPKEELPFVFERFYRADKSRNRATGGSGIGLAIVRSIVEAHGGSVQAAQSPTGQGSEFTVLLPREERKGS